MKLGKWIFASFVSLISEAATKPTHIFTRAAKENTLSLTSKQRRGQNSIQSMISIYPNDFNFEFSLTFGHQRQCSISAVLPDDSLVGLMKQAFQEMYTTLREKFLNTSSRINLSHTWIIFSEVNASRQWLWKKGLSALESFALFLWKNVNITLKVFNLSWKLET